MLWWAHPVGEALSSTTPLAASQCPLRNVPLNIRKLSIKWSKLRRESYGRGTNAEVRTPCPMQTGESRRMVVCRSPVRLAKSIGGLHYSLPSTYLMQLRTLWWLSIGIGLLKANVLTPGVSVATPPVVGRGAPFPPPSTSKILERRTLVERRHWWRAVYPIGCVRLFR